MFHRMTIPGSSAHSNPLRLRLPARPLAADNFDRANTTSAAGLGRTPVGDLPWTSTGWRIDAGRAYVGTGGYSRAHLDVGATRYTLRATVTRVGGTGTGGLHVRAVDDNNWCGLVYGAGEYRIEECVDGTRIILAGTGVGADTTPLTVTVTPARIEAWAGTGHAAVDTARFAGSTRLGLWGHSGLAVDDLNVTT